MPEFHEINVSPFATNVLDLVDVEGLTLPDKTPITVGRIGMGFKIIIGHNPPMYCNSNSDASYILNAAQVGKWTT